MKALLKAGKGRESVFLVEIEKPVPQKDELLVKIMAAGICGTDIHIMQEEYLHSVPVVLGHEFTGTIEEMGEDVSGFEIGDQIIALSIARTCGKCHYCRKGDLVHCAEKQSVGVNLNGAMAEYMIIPADVAMKVPENVNGSDVIAIAEPLACCIRSVMEQSTIQAGDVAVISGPGVIGLLTLQLVKLQGAFVIVTGTAVDQERLKLAKQLGADVINDDPARLKEIVDRYSDYGADVALECSGNGMALKGLIDVLRKGGRLTQIGLYGKPVPVEMDMIVRKEITLTAGFAQARPSWEILLKLVEQNKLNLEPLISHRIPLTEWEKGFELFLNKEGYKIFLIP